MIIVIQYIDDRILWSAEYDTGEKVNLSMKGDDKEWHRKIARIHDAMVKD